jgi:hypothetical protein
MIEIWGSNYFFLYLLEKRWSDHKLMKIITQIKTIQFVSDIANCWPTEMLTYRTGLFKTDIIRKLMIRHWWQCTLLLLITPQKKLFLNNEANITNWHCCCKRRPREANIFYVHRLASAWGSTINFNVLFLTYTSLKIRWSPKEFD